MFERFSRSWGLMKASGSVLMANKRLMVFPVLSTTCTLIVAASFLVPAYASGALTHFDRGHMTPNAAIAHCFGAEAQHETFLLSNICPQAPNLNQKVWEHLEQKELVYANEAGNVWIVDGPIFSDLDPAQPHPPRKLRSGIEIPEAFYKILVEDRSGGKGTDIRTFAVIMPQTVKGTESPAQYVRSIQDIETRTGLEFLWKLEPHLRARLIAQTNPLWPPP